MAGEVVIVLQPFLFFFSIAFDESMIHNMLALMLDPNYRGIRSTLGLKELRLW